MIDIDDKLLKNEEKAIFALRSLYKKYGYMPFKMSKFEEYDLYVRNKDFLVSDRIITFNDTNGKLLALKPDVTLSIIKSGEDVRGCKQKVCYNENVYRVSGSSYQYKEIMQAGLECIGDVDLYDIFEAVLLALKSLELISEEFILDISHLGILSALLDEISGDESCRSALSKCIAEKNIHDLTRICNQYEVPQENTMRLCRFAALYGRMDAVISELCDICKTEEERKALSELAEMYHLLQGTAYADRIYFDFSIVNNMNYYNGIVFQGFLCGICESVLAGGQYDKLMQKMGRHAGAVGFALYLDLLEGLKTQDRDYDVDVLLLYDEETERTKIIQTVKELTDDGKSVSAQKAVPHKLRSRQLVDLRKGRCAE